MVEIMSRQGWEVVEEKINQSKITRYPWKRLLGESLSSKIYKLRAKGMSSIEVFNVLSTHPKVADFIDQRPKERYKVLENLKISVCARFGESKTKEKVENDILER